MGQRAMLPQEQTEVVLSAKNQPAAAQLRAPGSLSLKPGAPVDIAWRDSSRTGVEETYEGRCSGCGYRCAMLASRQRSMLER